MNKVDYLSQLDDCLKCLPEQERREAMEFYHSYFEDGLENGKSEAQLIEELGTPQEAAEKIFKETGYKPGKDGYGATKSAQPFNGTASGSDGDSSKVLKIVLIVLACLFLVPPVGGVAIGLICAVFGIIIAIAAVLVVVPVALFAAGIACLSFIGTIGISAIGWSLILIGISLALIAAACAFCYGIVKLVSYIYEKISASVKSRRNKGAAVS